MPSTCPKKVDRPARVREARATVAGVRRLPVLRLTRERGRGAMQRAGAWGQPLPGI